MSHVDAERFVIERFLRAPPEAVFAAWTEPDQLRRWWGPLTITNDEVAMDARPGGAWRIAMRLPDGGRYPLFGTVVRAEAPRLLVLEMHTAEHPPEWHAAFAAAADRPVGPPIVIRTEVQLEARDDGTWMRVVQTFPTAADAAANAKLGAERGWGGSFVRLGALLGELATPPDTLVVQRTIAAPREVVFAAWTTARSLDAWWGPDGFRTTTESFEFAPGGTWRFTMVHPEHGTFPNRVAWRDIDAPERIAWHHDDGEGGSSFDAEAWFEVVDAGHTRLTMRTQLGSVEARRAVEGYAPEGGRQSLGRLAAHVERR